MVDSGIASTPYLVCQHILNMDAHPPDARTALTLIGIEGDALGF